MLKLTAIWLTHLLPGLLVTIFGIFLLQAVIALPAQPVGLTTEVQRELPNSGVTNPVTAVLLNFRGYDTLLEIGVLLLAVVAVWSLHVVPLRTGHARYVAETPVLAHLVRLLAPVMILVAGYITWIGSARPGGAFQGGSVLAAAMVLLLLASMIGIRPRRRWPLRVVAVLGLAVFVVIAGGTLVVGNQFLEYPRNQAYALMLVLESFLTISIGGTLALLFFGAIPETASFETMNDEG